MYSEVSSVSKYYIRNQKTKNGKPVRRKSYVPTISPFFSVAFSRTIDTAIEAIERRVKHASPTT